MIMKSKRRSRIWKTSSLTLFVLLCEPVRLSAQLAGIVGIVSDPSGAAIAGATVQATNAGSDLHWRVKTRGQGGYSFELLPPGVYVVAASATGFSPARSTGVQLLVNATARMDFRLVLREVKESLRVSAQAPLVETETSEQGLVIGGQTVGDLPLNGRDFLRLARLAPGVSGATDNPASPAGPVNVNGQRDLSNSIMIDGINVNAGGSANGRISLAPGNDPAAGQSGSSMGLVSVDAVAEFKVQTQTQTAEFGSFSGAVINVDTKSGSNELHGSASEFLRNSDLDANDFFNNAKGVPKPPARNNFFGGTLGGPIRKERTFFFVSFDGLRQAVAVSADARVPSLAARAGASPAIQNLIDEYPLPNGPVNGDDTAGYFATATNLVNETDFSVRLDHRISESDDLFGRYSFSDSLSELRSFYLNTLSRNRTRIQSVSLTEVHRVTPQLFNESRFGFVRSANGTIGAADNFGGAEPIPLNAAGDATLPGIDIFSLPFAESPTPPEFQNNNLFSFNDDVTYIHGRNTFKSGFWVRRVQDNPNLQPLSSGVYFFNTVADLLGNNPVSFFNQAAETDFGIRFTNLAFYFQDDLRITSRLKLNLGLRYELDTVPTEAHSRFSPLIGLDNVATATLGTPGSPVHNGDYDNFAPRLGFAYQLTQDAKTVLRGGAGIYYDQPTINATQLAFGPPFKITNFLLGTASGGSVTVPVDPASLVTTITGMPPFGSATVYDPTNFRTPFAYEYNLNLQRQIGSDTVIQASYSGALGRHLIRLQPLNLIDPATGVAPNGTFSAGALELIETDAVSDYNAFQANLKRRLAHGLELTASYTWAHSLDDASNPTGTSLNSSFTGSDPYDFRAEYASSDFDIRHNVVVAFTYELPGKSGHFRNPAAKLVGGWALEGLLTAQSGVPYTPLIGEDIAGNGDQFAANNQRPNLVPGEPLYITSTAPPYRVANPAAFAVPAAGAYGDAGRNILRAPGLTQLDLSLHKTTRVTERISAQFRAEFFNILNHPNFAAPAASGNNLLTAGSSFGLSQEMANMSSGGLLSPLFNSGGPRSIQLALKLLF
jgi:outer membrane receptor protein involved in Fe transport